MIINRYITPMDRCSKSGLHGFTLIELMITIAVMAILLAVAAPSFNDAVLGGKLASQANNLVGSAQLARGEAIKSNTVITLCASTNGTSCAGSGGWEQGWIVLSGANVIQRQQSLPTGLKMIQTVGDLSLSFQPTGVGTEQASLTVCRSSPVGNQERVVTINATGAATVKKTTSGSCS